MRFIYNTGEYVPRGLQLVLFTAPPNIQEVAEIVGRMMSDIRSGIWGFGKRVSMAKWDTFKTENWN